MSEFRVRVIPVVSVVSSVVHEGKRHNTQCVRLEKLCSFPIHHLLTFLWYGNMTNRQTDQKAPHTLLQSKQDTSWWSEMQIQFVYANEEQSRRAERATRSHVRLQNSASFQALSSDVKQTQCVWLTASGLILSVVSAVLCSVCCSSLWTAAPNLSVTLSKSYLDLFHECPVIINWLNAPLCIQPKVTMLLIKSQRSFLISEITRPIFSFHSDWIFNVFSASLPFIPKPLLNPAPSFFLFCFVFMMFYYLLI